MKWIPVTERLPIDEFEQGRENGTVFALYPCLVTRTASHSPVNPERLYVAKHYFDGENFLNNAEEVCDEVVAWAILPSPYSVKVKPKALNYYPNGQYECGHCGAAVTRCIDIDRGIFGTGVRVERLDTCIHCGATVDWSEK